MIDKINNAENIDSADGNKSKILQNIGLKKKDSILIKENLVLNNFLKDESIPVDEKIERLEGLSFNIINTYNNRVNVGELYFIGGEVGFHDGKDHRLETYEGEEEGTGASLEDTVLLFFNKYKLEKIKKDIKN